MVQETRGWSDDQQITTSQRSKEDAQDYRYMPDPDIPPIVLTDEEIAGMQEYMPLMPGECRERWADLGLDHSVITTILGHQPLAILLDAIKTLTVHNEQAVLDELGVDKIKYQRLVKRIFNWFASTPEELIDMDLIGEGYVGPRRLTELSLLVEDNEVSSTGGKEIFLSLFDRQYLTQGPREIAQIKNLLQVSDEGVIAAIVDEVLNDPASAASIADIRSGKDKAIGYLVGQVMKRSKGQANPSLAQKLIRERL